MEIDWNHVAEIALGVMGGGIVLLLIAGIHAEGRRPRR